MKNLLLGVDIGSGGCKISIVDRKGNLAASNYQEYKTYYPHAGWAEQDPRDWEESLARILPLTLKRANISPRDIACITIGAATHTVVPLDKKGKVLRPAILWTDKRTIEEVQWLKQNYGEMIIAETYHAPNVNWTLPYLLWIRKNEGEIWGKLDKILMPKDYIRYRLTNILATDFMDAHGTLIFNVPERKWSSKICNSLDIPMRILPEVLPATEIVGKVTAEASGLFGVLEGTPVLVGSTDQACEAFGSGAIDLKSGILKLATAGNVAVVTEKAYPAPPRVYAYYHLVKKQWYTLCGTSSCAVAYRWLRDTLFPDEAVQKDIYGKMDAMAASVPVGADGLIFHPTLQGSLGDPYMRADFLGMVSSHKREHLVRSVLEGVAFSLFDCLQREESLGVKAKEFRLIGGGAKSFLWRRIICDVFGRKILIPEESDSSFGTAILGGVGIGIFADFEDAVKQCVHIVEEIEPDGSNHGMYRQIFECYHESEEALKEMYHRLHAVTRPG